MVLRGVKYTLSELRTDLAEAMQDTTNTRWTSDNMDFAIKRAIRTAAAKWWEAREDDTNTYDSSDFRYSLPPACVQVQAVHFEPTVSTAPRYQVPPSTWRVEEGELTFKHRYGKYNGYTMYIKYLVHPTNLLETTGTNGAASSTTFTSATSTFLTDGVQEGDEVEITGDSGEYFVSSVDSETQLTLHTAPTAATGLTFYVARYTDMPYEYLMNQSMAELYELAIRNAPGVEAEDYIRLATYYRQLADVAFNEARRRVRTGRRR